MSYFGIGFLYIWRKSKNWFCLFITFSYSNYNNFSCISFPSKGGAYESRIDRWINYHCNKGTNINRSIKNKIIFYFLSLNLGKQFAIWINSLTYYYHVFFDIQLPTSKPIDFIFFKIKVFLSLLDIDLNLFVRSSLFTGFLITLYFDYNFI